MKILIDNGIDQSGVRETFIIITCIWFSEINVTEDVAGATIMATASSSPELFINIVGTFVTEGDLGVGTIVGSAVFNILAVPACCGLFANQVRISFSRSDTNETRYRQILKLESSMWERKRRKQTNKINLFVQVLNLEIWPVTRDTIAYAITVLLLILTLRDGRIEWYEGMILVLSYVLYILGKFMKSMVHC